MATTIRGIAHLNELTKDVANDYYLKPELKGALRTDEIIARLAKREIATQNVNGKAFVSLFLQECATAVSEGYSVVTDLFHASIGIHGTVLSKDLGHTIPADQLDVRMNFAQGTAARTAISNTAVSVGERPAPSGPDIQNVCNPTKNEPNVLNVGDMVQLQGLRIAVRGDQTDAIGVYFKSATDDTVVRIPADRLSPNTPTKLQFVLPPAVTAGEWYVSAKTQATSTTAIYVKDVRESLYPFVVTVVA